MAGGLVWGRELVTVNAIEQSKPVISIVMTQIVLRHAGPRTALLTVFVLLLHRIMLLVILKIVSAWGLIDSAVGTAVRVGQFVRQADIAGRVGACSGERKIGRIVADRRVGSGAGIGHNIAGAIDGPG